MKLKFSGIIFLLLIVINFFIPENALAANYTLEGRVQTSSGTAIDGATVDVKNSSNNVVVATTTTDSTGDYDISIEEGIYNVQITPQSGSGFSSAIALSQNINANTVLNFILTPSGTVTLSGHIYSQTNKPLPNQDISLQTSNGITVATSTTDSNGYYSLTVTNGTYKIYLRKPNGNNIALDVPERYLLYKENYVLNQSTIHNITLPTKKVRVHVQDAAGVPVSGVNIYTGVAPYVENLSLGAGITDAYGNTSYNFGSGPNTDSSGNADVYLFPTGTSNQSYTLIAMPPSGSGFSTTTLPNVSFSDDKEETVVLPATVSLSGHIYSQTNKQLPNQDISLQNSSGITIATTTTNSTGYYSFAVAPGTYKIFLRKPSGNNITLDVPERYLLYKENYVLNQSVVHDITLPTKKVRVHVQDAAGVPVSGVNIYTGVAPYVENLPLGTGITDAYGNTSYNYGSGPNTDSSGNADIYLFPTGTGSQRYTLVAMPPSGSIYSNFTLNNISVVDDQTELIQLEYNHARPVTNVTLVTQHSDGTYSNPATVTLSAEAAAGYTIANTYYKVDGGVQQTYSGAFEVSGEGSHSIEYWSVDNSGVTEVHKTKPFTIVPRYSLTGTVYVDVNQNGFQDEGEQGYAGATIGLDFGQTATTDTAGTYTFANIVSGSYIETLSVPTGYTATTTNPVETPVTADTTVNFGIALAPTATPTNAPPVITSLTTTVTTIARNNSVTMNAAFSDQNVADTHTATWNWGDGTTTTCPPDIALCTMTESNGSGIGTATHTYATANVYTVTLTITDNANASDTEAFQYITVYDPNDGWATGDREYTSPQGSVIGNTTATGKTEFGFTARYVNGVLQPVGNKWASVSFDAGAIDFVASAYNSLVITGNKIVLRGTGSLNGVSGYSVLISALDNGNQGTSYIRYQIKNSAGIVVYDTQPGEVDTANPTTPLTKGKIQIH